MTEVQRLAYIIALNYINVTIGLLLPFNILKYKGKRLQLGYWLISLAELLLFTFIRIFTDMPAAIRASVCFLLVLLIIIFCFNGTRKMKFMLFVSFFLLMILSEILAAFMVSLIMQADHTSWEPFGDSALMGMVLMNMIGFILHMYYLVFWKLFVEKIKLKGWLLYLIVPFYHLLLLMIFYEKAEGFNSKTAIFGIGIMIMNILINYVIMYLLRNMEMKVAAEEELKQLNAQRKYEMDYYKMINQYMDQMRGVRHEFINQIQTAYVMIQSGKNGEKTELLLGEACRQMDETRLHDYSGNSVLDALLSVKAMQADQADINMKVVCEDADFAGIKGYDLCSLAGSMIDNAIEACARIPLGEEKHICIYIFKRDNYQQLRVTNTYHYEEGIPDFRNTSKPDKEKHGYGIKLMEEICQKYSGALDIVLLDKLVQVTASIKLT